MLIMACVHGCGNDDSINILCLSSMTRYLYIAALINVKYIFYRIIPVNIAKRYNIFVLATSSKSPRPIPPIPTRQRSVYRWERYIPD